MNPILNARRARAAAAWNLTDEIVLVAAGEPVGIPGGQDQTYPFISHAEYLWLADREVPGAIVAFDPKSGWTDFVPEVTDTEKVWEGKVQPEGEPLTLLPAWLAARRGRGVLVLGSGLRGFDPPTPRTQELRDLLNHARRPKDELELDRMRRACAASTRAYAAIVPMIRPGITERSLQIELETEFFRGGGDRTAYETIIASGPRSAVLHAPATGRKLQDGELLLIDAGAQLERYASDVTRTYAVNGRLQGLQKDLYDVVLQAEVNACERCTPGTVWRDVHLGAARDMVAGLVGLGLMKGKPDALVERGAHMLFFPHGLGHMVGLGVRDASGRLPGAKEPMPPMLKNLRTDFPLEPGYVITVEPGLYFIPPLLENAENRKQYADCVDWDRVTKLYDFGGIRIEDNILVTKGKPENLTAAIPK